MINSPRGAIFTGETCFYDTGAGSPTLGNGNVHGYALQRPHRNHGIVVISRHRDGCHDDDDAVWCPVVCASVGRIGRLKVWHCLWPQLTAL